MNPIKEQDALEFAYSLISLYFSKRDLMTLPCHMEERISWIGSGEDEVSRNLVQVQNALAGDLLEYSGRFTVTDIHLDFMPVSLSGAVVYGTLKAVPADQTLSDENIRITAVLAQTDDGLKLAHMHCSHADSAQEHGTHFVKQAMRTDNESLRTALNIRERQLANLTKNIPGGVHQCANDSCLTLLSMSDGFLSMFGYTKEEIKTLFGGKFMNMIYPVDRAEMIQSTSEQLKHGSEIELEYRVLCKNGPPVWVLDQGRLMDNGNGERCFYCLLMDITKRKCQQEELRLSLDRHRVIMDQATDIIFEWDIVRDTLDFSSNWKKKFGYDAIDHQISSRIPLSENIHESDMPAFVQIMENMVAGAPYAETEFRIKNSCGNYYWCRIRATAQYNSDGRPIKAIGVIVDIDREKKQKQALIQQAQNDALTGIYNKAAVNALIEQRMPEKEVPGYHALFIIDVDYFKAVNDTYGHLCGDFVLSDVAAALKGGTSSDDLVGRIGGDEFLIYLPQIASETLARQKAEQILQAVKCIRPEPTAAPITCSIGAVILPHGSLDFQKLYQCADRALYQQKNSRRGGVAFFDFHNEQGDTESLLPASAVGNTIVSDEGNVVDEWLAQYAFRTLYAAKAADLAGTFNRLLEIIGRSFDVSRVYIFESSEDGTRCSNTFEWCNDHISSQMDQLQNIAYVDELGDYQKNFDQNGTFYCHDIESLHPDVYAILEPQGIRSMLQCAMLDEGAFVGYVGFDECRENTAWSDRQVIAFKLTADVLSTFVIKLRLKHPNVR